MTSAFDSHIDPEYQGEDRQILNVFYDACMSEGGTADEIQLRGIRAVLAARPAPQPPAEGEAVPVSERLPEPGDCDGKGRCWAWNPEAISYQ